MFGMFYDMSSVWLPSNSESAGVTLANNKPPQGVYILLTTVSGKALRQYHSSTDSEIVDMCVQCLRLMFGTVSPVLGYLVSRWGSDPHVSMSYSYVSVGSTGSDYDIIAETAHQNIHFAGEVNVNYTVVTYS